jgi:hypothetical protein
VLEFTEPRGFFIGRAKDNDFQLSPDDPYVACRHVYLEISPPSCRLRDLGTEGRGSTNVPHVNGKPVTECGSERWGCSGTGFHTTESVVLDADCAVHEKLF